MARIWKPRFDPCWAQPASRCRGRECEGLVEPDQADRKDIRDRARPPAGRSRLPLPAHVADGPDRRQDAGPGEDLPEGHRPQGFVCGAVWGVDDHGVTGGRRGTRLDVVARVSRPVIGANPVSPPYLFMGVVGLEEGAAAWSCLHGHAQPIVAMNCPVPVESSVERQAFGTLRKTLGMLRREFDTVTFSLEKPLFETNTQYGPCLPDFVIRAHPEGWDGKDSVGVMIEVMGFEDEDYRKRKEETHRAMRSLGTLCTMEAGRFGSPEGLASEGTDVTDKIRAVLRRRLA